MAIKGIEYKVIDRSFGYGLVVLVAGDQLNKAHHFVAVYDCNNCINGLSIHSLPKIKLGKKIT